MNDQETRIAFAKRQGWDVVHSYGNSEFATKDSDIWHLRLLKKLQVAFSWNNFKGKIGNPTLANCIGSLPDPTDHNHVDAALMGMSAGEWERFGKLVRGDKYNCGVIETLKTPLSVRVACYLGATKGRVKYQTIK